MPKSTDPQDPTSVTPALLREWSLPAVADSKYGRGQVVVVGGARKSPGAAMLSGLGALRVGAGRLTLVVADSVADMVAVAVPESGVVALGETSTGHVEGSSIERASSELESADAVLIGPGLDDADETVALLRGILDLLSPEATLILDAYALGVLPRVPELVERFAGRLVLTPNREEAARLLDREMGDPAEDIAEVAERYSAVVSCYGTISAPDGKAWLIGTGAGGLATSGSGDVLAGAIAGLAARGADPSQAAVWGTHVHAAAGDALSARIAPVGYLASELLSELPALLAQLGPDRS